MSYKEKPQIRLYSYSNSTFTLQAIIDDYQECSFDHNLYEAGQFTITINYNIPNALLFNRGLWVQFGNNPYNFGEILNITDSIGSDGKGSQRRIITGYDSRYIFKRRIIKSLNSENTWTMTAKGELCLRNLILDQCGSNAEVKRRLPVTNTIPASENAIGSVYSVSESFTNLYEVLTTIATQTEIGWRLNFNGSSLILECYQGVDRHSTVRFDTNYDSLSSGEFKDSSDSYANTVYVGGKGSGENRDIYEGETEIEGASPSGLDRYESWDNQSSMTTEEEYEAEALSILSQYGQTLQVSGQGLAQCPYIYGDEYEVGDTITIAFSGKSAIVQILSITEHWGWGAYNIEFEFGKPLPDLSKQLQLILKQIQKATDKTTSTESVKWYTMPTDTVMNKADVTYDTIGFVGQCASGGSTFTLYLDDEKTGAKTYHVYFKQLSGGTITFTTGKSGANNLTLNNGTYVAIIYVDENGNVTLAGSTSVNSLVEGSFQPVTSGAVASAVNTINGDITGINGKIPSSASSSNQLTDKEYVDGIPATTLSQLGDSGSASSISDSTKFITDENKEVTGRQIADYTKSIDNKPHNIFCGNEDTGVTGYYEVLTVNRRYAWECVGLTMLITPRNGIDYPNPPALVQLVVKSSQDYTGAPAGYFIGGDRTLLSRLYLAYSTTTNISPKLYIKELGKRYRSLKINILDYTSRVVTDFDNKVTIASSPTLITDIPSDYDTVVCLADLV